MNSQVIETLSRARYKVLTNQDDLEQVYRLRYDCYRAEGSIVANESRLMTDPFDESPNCVHVSVELDGEVFAAVRLHVMSKLTPTSPTLEVFPELMKTIRRGQTALDVTRFVITPAARKQRVPLHFLVLRIPFLATMFYDIDVALAPVRTEHTAFYRRYLGYEIASEPRSYPALKKPIQLLTAKVREQRAAVLKRTPVFGPVSEVPHSNIDFPELADVYVASKSTRFEAA
ncbi:N-acyl amino acid synthase FeeM domain-containing protein [Gymnodinialimonas ceratoperidinii]|uniref:GNAT family N-acetyltransferase n=1 Tax=Gymnodinialimonas ceratoperidinii TaxID=2856823 RepID=A0A8F6TXS6_9RHOB|nr:GNAT family N-acyltransferase [Gymnodinialimonas ceratoperidinii]QXT40625.1 GNAT family N-acetyltransferase [Gymnodinialimonas ceratoperidinii]